MIPTILAATILGSIPAAVEKTLQEQPLQLVTQAQFDVLAARVERGEKIRDSTIACIAESLIWTGGDLGLTDVAKKRCPMCIETNLVGFDGMTGLKLAESGAEVGLCLLSAKHQHNEGDSSDHRHGKWISRAVRLFLVFNGAWAVVTGRPLISWGAGQPGNLK